MISYFVSSLDPDQPQAKKAASGFDVSSPYNNDSDEVRDVLNMLFEV